MLAVQSGLQDSPKPNGPGQPRVLCRAPTSVTLTNPALRGAKAASHFAAYCRATGAGVALAINKTSMELPGGFGLRVLPDAGWVSSALSVVQIMCEWGWCCSHQTPPLICLQARAPLQNWVRGLPLKASRPMRPMCWQWQVRPTLLLLWRHLHGRRVDMRNHWLTIASQTRPAP